MVDSTHTPIKVRLRRLSDVLQQVHRIKRSVAYRLIADACGVSERHISNVVTDQGDKREKPKVRLDVATLAAMEAEYALPLQTLTVYEGTCARYKEAA